MYNLIRNPNITASHLFRADIFWDSDTDTTFNPAAINTDAPLSSFVKHMRADYQPWKIDIEGFTLQRTIVRQLVPRNPDLDKTLAQTCHFLSGGYDWQDSREENHSTTFKCGCEEHLVIYLPHASSGEEVPWYHPPVQALSFLHSTHPDHDRGAILSIHYSQFDANSNAELLPRTEKTLKNLLTTIHKHSTSGQKYVKKVHHDQIIPQKRFQDTYTRLKHKYAKQLIANWREQTAVGKSVFEDLGIAAFLIELWNDEYGSAKGNNGNDRHFPGFVDLACGNGCLVLILRSEGYDGWGFDARSRKTWEAFPPFIQDSLKEMILVPSILGLQACPEDANTQNNDLSSRHADGHHSRPLPAVHNGIFPPGTFLISNHADELTPWTPLLAYLINSPFIAIPCCSHTLDGSKYRYPRRYVELTKSTLAQSDTSSPSSKTAVTEERMATPVSDNVQQREAHTPPSPASGPGEAAKRSLKEGSPPSAYATLIAYVTELAASLGYHPEKEILRIPSTRNVCIIARCVVPQVRNAAYATVRDGQDSAVYEVHPSRGEEDVDETLSRGTSLGPDEMSAEERMRREDVVKKIVARDARKSLEEVAVGFKQRAMRVYESKGRNH